MKVKYSRFRHNAKQTSFTSPTGPRRQGGEHEHAQYPANDDVTSGWSCRRPENVSILSSLVTSSRQRENANASLRFAVYLMLKVSILAYSWLTVWQTGWSLVDQQSD